MRDIARFDLPYAPALREMPARGAGELKRLLDDIVTPGDIQRTAAASVHASAGALRACCLTGGGCWRPCGSDIRRFATRVLTFGN